MDPVHVVIRLGDRPSNDVLLRLHRILDLSLHELARRIAMREPVADIEVSGNAPFANERKLRALLDATAASDVTVHLVRETEDPGPESQVTAGAVFDLLAASPADVPARRPSPDQEIATRVADATRAAWRELPAAVRDDACLVALVTSGEALRPYFAITVHDPDEGDPWDIPDSPHVVLGDEHFEALTAAWDATPDVFADRMATLEEALRTLDIEGLFGSGAARENLLLQVTTMPPDLDDAGYVRRLNADSPLLQQWLTEASECPPLRVDGPTDNPTASRVAERAAPNASLAALWRMSPVVAASGILLADGTTVYGADNIDERNATYQIADYAPGWVLIGDDSGGSGLLMRRGNPDFRPEEARTTAGVYLLDLGIGDPDVESWGRWLTDDLIGWLACRQVGEVEG